MRFASDWRTVVWAFVLFPATSLAQYAKPSLLGWCLPLSLYVGFCAGVLSHNQTHCRTFRRRDMNAFYSTWLSVFYGHPIFAWIPTHLQNHHKFLNRAGDAGITWRYSKENGWWVAATYFLVSAWWQRPITDAFLRTARATNPRLLRQIRWQVAGFVAAHIAALATAIALHGPWRGLGVYLCAFGAPMFMGLWGMMFINFVQHVHCDPWSKHDHSRNFTGRVGNWLTFNAGLHTAHHEHPRAHWSRLPALHAEIAGAIHPALLERGLVAYCLRVYLLGAFDRRFRTRQVGIPAYRSRSVLTAAVGP